MRKFLVASSVAVWLLAPVVAFADEQIDAIIAKAVKAHGGAEVIAEFEMKASISKAKGRIEQAGGIDCTMEISATLAGKFKNVINGETMGIQFTQEVGFNGDEMWITVNGMDVSGVLGEGALEEAKEQFYQETVQAKVLLGDKSLKLSTIGEAEIHGKPAVGIKASSEGHRDVDLYFDKESGLLVKAEFRAVDIQTHMEVQMERLLSGHKKVAGVVAPHKVTILRDGEKFMEFEIEEVKIVDSIPDGEFEKP